MAKDSKLPFALRQAEYHLARKQKSRLANLLSPTGRCR
jgi:hypothetical protein